MDRKNDSTRPLIHQARVEFTSKPVTAFGGVATTLAKFLEVINFRSWVETSLPGNQQANGTHLSAQTGPTWVR